jgi:2'-5' RNA ligase
VWAGARHTPPALRALAAALADALAALPWPVDERPYTPHVTLVRDARRPPALREVALPPWSLHDFALVQSSPTPAGVRYAPLARWPLKGDG